MFCIIENFVANNPNIIANIIAKNGNEAFEESPFNVVNIL